VRGYETPFRGIEPFRPEDEHLFVRDESVRQSVLSMVLGSPVSVFFGPSGAGKTSFLQASLFPDLERRGWMPVRVRPGLSPLKELHRAIRLSCVPGPEQEAVFLDRLAARVGGHLSLAHAAATLALKIDAGNPPLRGTLASTDPAGAVTPFTLRWVRRAVGSYLGARRAGTSTASLERDSSPLARVLATNPLDPTWDGMFALAYGTVAGAGPFHEQTVDDLRELLRRPRAGEAAQALEARIRGFLPDDTPHPESLALGLSRLALLYVDPALPRFRLVLVLDQFEEIFTRVATSTASQEDRLAPRDVKSFLRALESLASLMATGSLDLHLIVSLREEFVGRLHAALDFLPGGSVRLWRLGLLTADEAIEAVARPAEAFGAARPRALGRRLVAEIADLEERVQPAHLQILFGEVWRRGHQDQTRADVAPDARELMQAYVGRLLGAFTEDERFDVLDMLGMLITPDQMRNIVRLDRLVRAPLRLEAVRLKLLERLEGAAIVRIEERSGARYAEITHEFLIDAITSARGEEGRAVERCLRLLNASDPAEVDWSVARAEYRALRDGRVSVAWTEKALTTMLRGALALGRPADVPHWGDRFGSVLRQGALRRLRSRADSPARRADPLELSDLRSLWAVPVSELTRTQREVLLWSSLRRVTAAERPAFLYWLEEVVHGP